jgi:ABC-type transport system involved in cytochrome c biogenesis ATPase subunit
LGSAGEPTALRLESFHVSKLFGEFDHHIPLSPTSRVTALIAPNGIGKTACLRLINALFRRQWSVFTTTEFYQVEYIFSDQSRVLARHGVNDELTEEPSIGVCFETHRAGEIDIWYPKINEQSGTRLLRVEQYLPFLTRTAPARWVHDHTGQILSIQEIVDTYREHLPDAVFDALNARPSPLLSNIVDSIDCHLIETQRLLIIPEDVPRRSAPSTLTISKKSQTLRSIISRELTAYASLSQSLDRSFPKRVIQKGPIQPTDDLKASLQQLDANRRKLMDAGILDTEQDDALLPPGEVDSAVAAVLSVYVTDTQRKLASLSTILSRITLFIELIDNRFRPKSISVDKSVGFVVKRGADIVVPLEKLSSGEQHQLVLFFELLFELKENALILIDEPELSLHVAWQKKFIPDLQRIIGLNKFDVLLATHSPQLIGRWEDLVVELGDVDSE